MRVDCIWHRYETLGSTNDEAARLLQNGAADHLHVIVAQEQTQGRGRLGRSWDSQNGNLFASLIVKPNCEQKNWPQLSFVIALAIAKTCDDVLPANKKICLKWPNDVLVDDKKIAGILLEMCTDLAGHPALIIGFGVNCLHVPENTLFPATSLAAHNARIQDAEKVASMIIQNFLPLYDMWQADGFAPIRKAWLARAWRLNETITVNTVKGVFKDIAPDHGALLLEEPNGRITHMLTGDVV